MIVATTCLSVAKVNLWSDLDGDGHDDEIRTFHIIAGRTDDNRRSLFAAALVGKRKWHQYNVAEPQSTWIKGHRRRRLRRYSKSQQTQARWSLQQRA